MADRKFVQNRSKPARPVKAVASEAPAAVVEPVKAAPVPPKQVAQAPQPKVEAPIVRAPVAPAPVAKIKPVAATIETKVEPQLKSIEAGANTMTDTINATVDKAQATTQQATQQATEQFRGALDQVAERSKVAVEKSNRLVEEMSDLTRGNLEALVASQKTAAKFVESLTQGAADYNRRTFEEASTALRSFAEAKSPTDIFRLQSDFARSAFDSWIGESARVSETVVKMTGEVAEPLTSRVAVAAERMKTVAA